MFTKVRDEVSNILIDSICWLRQVATIDVLQSFATISENTHYVDQSWLSIVEKNLVLLRERSTPPVVEKSYIGQQTIVPNSVGNERGQTEIMFDYNWSKKNMSGKSTLYP